MKISDYILQDKLFKGRNFFIYRGMKENDNTPYILKLLEVKTASNVNVVNSIKSEYGYLKQLDSPFVIKAIDWVEDKNYVVIVLEDINGKSLKDVIKKGWLSIERFIPLAVRVTTGLADIHRQNIIHKDVNPSNIIWNPQTGELKIIDFNLASKYDVKVSYLGNPEKLQGTLPYVSPEQTGRVNRRVDQRSDLYSLGVTFYEMVTGQLPFQHQDPMEIVYSHLARPPVPPHLFNEKVPGVLSQIILKLLAKNPEERYQSVEGLKYDLKKIQQLPLSEIENIEPFVLGEKDFSGKLHIPETLYGRETEIRQLLDVYHEVGKGAKEIIMVTGYSGTGKTALVNEIHKPISRDRGYFISGKFDQLQRTVPYSAFIQALNQFCRLLLTERREVLDRWKKIILQAVDNLGKVLTDIIPFLESVIGEQPNVPDVGGEESKKRFNYVFQRFLQAVSSEEHPLVMFIDDLQWTDLASLDLLRLLAENPQNRYLLFIGAYRDNEVSPTHPLMTSLDEIQKQNIAVHTIPVKNLSPQNIREWVGDALKTAGHAEKKSLEQLTDLIIEKTRGNAFFTIQFLKNLYEENLLRFDFKTSKWVWDIKEIKKQEITDNVVDLLIRKIKNLSVRAQESIKFAACIGNAFGLDTLSVISGKSAQEHREILEIALAEQLIYPQESDFYKFIHDRIHQAAYSMIPENETKPLHLEIGRLLLKNVGISDTTKISREAEKYIFDIVNHLNIGIDLIAEQEEKIGLVRLNLKAGHNAKISAAYSLGDKYIRTALQLLPGDCWERYYDLALYVYNEAIETSYLCGNFEEMEKLIESVLARATDISHRSIAYECRIMSLITQSQERKAAEKLLEIFSTLGVDIPMTPDPEQVNRILIDTHALLEKKGLASIKNLPMISDPQKQLFMRLLSVGAGAFVFGAQELLPIVSSRMVEMTLKYGIADGTPYILGFYGIIRLFMGDIPGAYRLGEVSSELLEKRIHNEASMVRSNLVVHLYLSGNKLHFKESCKRLIDTYPHALNVGDFEYAGYILTNYIQYLARTDIELRKWKEKVDGIREKIIQLKQTILLGVLSMETSYNSNLLGETSNPAVFKTPLDDMLDSMDAGSQILFKCLINARRITLAVLFDAYDDVLSYINIFEESWKSLTTPLTFLRSDYFFFIPLAYMQLYGSAPEDCKEKYLSRAKESIETMKAWSKLGPLNFLHKYYLLKAELYRLKGKHKQAENFYDKAIEAAYENGYINEAALANELAAKHYLQKKKHKFAAIYILEARNGYRRWGAVAKIRHLEEKYPKYLSLSNLGSMQQSTGTISSNSSEAFGDILDIKSIIKSSQTLSGEVQLKGLLEKMMRILIENAGAKKSVLIENTGASLLIQAEGTTYGISGILQELPVEGSDKVPLSVINYVAHSKETLVFDNISRDPNYSADSYIQKNQSKSVVCFPILSKGELSAIIYLENNLVEGAFTPARLEILNMLSAQIAISVENTHLYEQLEEKVRQRTVALQRANAELERNHKELEESHRKINDSVNYASKIQHAVLPARESFEKLFPRSFIVYRPCSVVSGDFYWIKQIGHKIIVTAADCTGHGIPGALVSMLGMAFLNEIVPQLIAQSRLNADNILNELRRQVKIALQQKGKLSEQKDGMDIVLCIIDPVEKQLQYAGAYNPLYLIKDDQLTEVKGDRMPVGIYRKERPFTLHEMSFEGGEMIYLCTDGFIHQNCPDGSETFTRKRFKQLLLEINRETVSRQEVLLMERFEEWRGNLPQRDDILILGIRL
jgi:histidine kinase